MADKRASKPVVAANLLKSSQEIKSHPQTTRAPSLTKQMRFVDLKEDYFKERKVVSGLVSIDEEQKEINDDESVYHSLKENYLNYRSSS
jgi:hypothetical protein